MEGYDVLLHDVVFECISSQLDMHTPCPLLLSGYRGNIYVMFGAVPSALSLMCVLDGSVYDRTIVGDSLRHHHVG